MVMNSGTKIDVVARPGIELPPGYRQEPRNLRTSIDELQAESKGQSEAINPIPHEPTFEEKQDEEMKSLFEKFEESKSDSLGWVQKDEVTVAKKRIKESLGFPPPPMAGWYMAVVVHEEKYARTADGRVTNFMLASADNEKYRNCAGLVVAQGPECYTGPRFEEHWSRRLLRVFFNRWMAPNKKKPWCRVGDWVMFPRHEGQLCNYRGLPIMMLPDVKIYTPIEHPSYVTRDF